MEQQRTKFSVQIFLYNVDRFILPALANCGPLVDRIYVIYSQRPWSRYNPAAPSLYTNRTPLEIIERSPYRSKITVLAGDWASEPDARNAALDRARADGMDWMIVHDADEYYTFADYQQNLDFMAAHPEAAYFRARWYLFWKTTGYVILSAKGELLSNCENFAVNCRTNVRFSEYRRVDAPAERSLFVPGVCFHLSNVYSNDEMVEKISTWGHARQVEDARRWFERKWRHWHEGTRFLSPFHPQAGWWKAIPFKGELPEVLRDFANPPLEILPRTLGQKLAWGLSDLVQWLRYWGWRAEVALSGWRKRLKSALV